ncbi:hypothetical protein ACTVL4_12240 [Serratia nevei]|uniref:hypothetical protein n=1 Tax=Serratia nevei TaxID=2703794 RepID=UPI003FA7BB70
MTSSITSLLEKTGPCLSSVLVDEMSRNPAISRETARKQISRAVATGQVRCVDKLLPKRERFIYLQKQYGSERYWSNLTTALLNSGSAYGLALSCIMARGGILKMEHFAAASGAPEAMKKRLSWRTVLEGLLINKMVRQVSLPGIGDCIALSEKKESAYAHAVLPLKARHITESIMLKAVGQWVRNTGIISYDTLRTRDNTDGDLRPCVSQFSFDMSAASYLNPLLQQAKTGETRPGFFVCDILLGSRLNHEHLQPFIVKCRSISSLKNNPRCLFMFIADEYAEDAFMALKRAGIIPATPESLFGSELAETLLQLRELISYMTLHLDENISQIDDIMSKLSRIEGATTQLQGDLFEYIVAEAVRGDNGFIDVGRLCKNEDGKSADCDVMAIKARSEITFIECKGYKPYSVIKHEVIKHWIGHQIPVFRKFARRDYPNTDVNVELWTTGKFSEETRDMLDKYINSVDINKKYNVRVMEAHNVRQIIRATRNDSLIRVFEKHFIDSKMKVSRQRTAPEPTKLAGRDDDFDDEF